jgi:acetyl esterase/lipase
MARRWIRWTLVAAATVAAAAGALLVATPWPTVLAIRAMFDRDAAAKRRALEAHAPGSVATIADVPYRNDDEDALLDVFVPDATAEGERLPTLVWVHGGAWISGDKADVGPYCAILAAEGYAVVSVGYTIAPEAAYPTPLLQVHHALAHLIANADRLHVDPERLALAGDSAGAQIVSQVAVAVTDPRYAADLGIEPAIGPDQLRAVVLHCGFYDLATFVERGRLAPIPVLRWGIRAMVWAYTGSRATDSPALRQMSTLDHVGSSFPPAFVGGGNGDPLTAAHSVPFAERLERLGVDVTTLFYADDHEPALPHEYQFDLDTPEGRDALDRTVAFLDRHLR